jgi:hypothetical protein
MERQSRHLLDRPGLRVVVLDTAHGGHYYNPVDVSLLDRELRHLETAIGASFERPPLPPMILVGVPRVYRHRFFPNLLVWHEIGHAVYDAEGLWNRVVQRSGVRLASSRLTQQVNTWLAEIMSDVLGVAGAGLAYMEAFVAHAPGKPSYSESHPPNRLRMHAQFRVLKRLGWTTAPIFGPRAAALRRHLESADSVGLETDFGLDDSERQMRREAVAVLKDLTGAAIGLFLERFPRAPGQYTPELAADLDELTKELYSGAFWDARSQASGGPPRNPVAVLTAYAAALGTVSSTLRPSSWNDAKWHFELDRWASQKLQRRHLKVAA